MTEETTEIDEILDEICLLKKQIQSAEARLNEAGLRQMGLKVGDLVEVEGKGVVYVDGCDIPNWSRRPRPIGRKVKKEGTVGQQSAGYIGDRGWRKL